MKAHRDRGKRPRAGKNGAKDHPSHLRAAMRAKSARSSGELRQRGEGAGTRAEALAVDPERGRFKERARAEVAAAPRPPRAEEPIRPQALPLVPFDVRAREADAALRLPPRAMTPRPDMQLPNISIENVDWEDTSDTATLSPHARWARAERELDRRLGELDARHHRCRADLREGRLVWTDDAGTSVVEARAQILCTLAQPSLALTMAWADPMLMSLAVARVDDMPDEQNLVDDESARDIAMRVAEASGAEFVYRMPAPNVDYFVGLRALKRSAGAAMLTPGTPVGLVLRGLSDLRRALSAKKEPTHTLRARFQDFGRLLVERSQGEFAGTEWVGRLSRAGKLLLTLAARLAPPTFTAIAAGLPADDWLPHDVALELTDALKLLEDEWEAFAH